MLKDGIETHVEICDTPQSNYQLMLIALEPGKEFRSQQSWRQGYLMK